MMPLHMHVNQKSDYDMMNMYLFDHGVNGTSNCPVYIPSLKVTGLPVLEKKIF